MYLLTFVFDILVPLKRMLVSHPMVGESELTVPFVGYALYKHHLSGMV